MSSRFSALLSMLDSISGSTFLIDTGAQVSMLPPSSMDHTTGSAYSGLNLQAANGSSIKCFGKVTHDVCFRGRRYSGRFVIANVKCPLLGVDFLLRHQLLVDVVAASFAPTTFRPCAAWKHRHLEISFLDCRPITKAFIRTSDCSRHFLK